VYGAGRSVAVAEEGDAGGAQLETAGDASRADTNCMGAIKKRTRGATGAAEGCRPGGTRKAGEAKEEAEVRCSMKRDEN
jgi:hypothetical protein